MSQLRIRIRYLPHICHLKSRPGDGLKIITQVARNYWKNWSNGQWALRLRIRADDENIRHFLNGNKSAISFYKWKCPDSECVSDFMSLASTELLCSSQTQAWQPVSTKTDSDTKNYEYWNWIFVEFINSNKSPKFTIVCETETEADEYQQLSLWLT